MNSIFSLFLDSTVVQPVSVNEGPSEGTGDPTVHGEGWLQHRTGTQHDSVLPRGVFTLHDNNE